MDKAKLKAICVFARGWNTNPYSTENMKGWRGRLRISQEKNLNVLHDAPYCTLETFVSNITSIIYSRYEDDTHGLFLPHDQDHTTRLQCISLLRPYIAKSLGYKTKP